MGKFIATNVSQLERKPNFDIKEISGNDGTINKRKIQTGETVSFEITLQSSGDTREITNDYIGEKLLQTEISETPSEANKSELINLLKWLGDGHNLEENAEKIVEEYLQQKNVSLH